MSSFCLSRQKLPLHDATAVPEDFVDFVMAGTRWKQAESVSTVPVAS